MNPHTQRAYMLLQQRRHELAEREIGMALGEDPEDGVAHALMALSLSIRDRHTEAAERAELAVACLPLDPDVNATGARVALLRNDLDRCDALSDAAITLSPHDVRPYVTKAGALARRKSWRECLAVVEQALAIDPQQTEALNLRSLANRGLGRKESHGGDIRRALHSDPEDPHTHANAGWASLADGDVATAETHFREALRLDPSLEAARVGVLETTKSKFPVYRVFLGYLLWTARQGSGRMFLLVLGAWLGVRLLGRAADAYPAVVPIAAPVVLAYVAFCFATWFWRPVSNAALLLHPFARLALTTREKVEAAACTLVFTLLGGLFVGSFFDTSGNAMVFFRSLLGPGLAAAFSFQFEHPRPKRILMIAAGVLTATAAMGLTLHYGGAEVQQRVPPWLVRLTFGPLEQLRLWGPLGVVLGSQWLGSQHWKAR